jgi:hypothetical protein
MSSTLPPNKTTTVDYGEIIYEKEFKAFNGTSYSTVAKIRVLADPEGVIRSDETYEGFKGAVPGKIQFFTANDDGNLYLSCEIDKSGKFASFNQLWSVSQNPSGFPLMLVSNCDEPGRGASLSMRRSRGNYFRPKRVEKNDKIFNLSWWAHDGQSYKESISVTGIVIDDVDVGKINSELSFKFLSRNGSKVESFKISEEKISTNNISGLDSNTVSLDSALKLKRFETSNARDKSLLNPELGSLIYLEENDAVQVFTKKGWINLS